MLTSSFPLLIQNQMALSGAVSAQMKGTADLVIFLILIFFPTVPAPFLLHVQCKRQVVCDFSINPDAKPAYKALRESEFEPRAIISLVQGTNNIIFRNPKT